MEHGEEGIILVLRLPQARLQMMWKKFDIDASILVCEYPKILVKMSRYAYIS